MVSRMGTRQRLAVALATLIAVGGAALSLSSPASAVADGRLVYSPDLATHPGADAAYPRVIRLEHGGDALLATFASIGEGVPGNLPIYRSPDGGGTWSRISTIESNTPGWDLVAPVLYEVPRTANGLTAGDLLASGTAWNVGDFTAQKIEVFKSTDHGETWQYLSSCTETSGMPNTIGHGIWEPWFLLADDNTLACFISDERPANSPTNDQVIGHYTSADGGLTWSDELTLDVAFPHDNLARPGMSIITSLPNGDFVMAYELCRDATNPDHACEVYIKFSDDGLDWGQADDAGTLVTTADGRHLLHTPYIAWSPAGGPNGTLLLSGQRVVTGPTGNKTVLPESGKVLFANTNLGVGAWHQVAAPITVEPTGGYAPGVPSCPGYSSPILPSTDGAEVMAMAGTWLGVRNQCEVRFGFGGVGTLPVNLPHTEGVKEGFAEYGGSWQVPGDVVSVTNSVAGSKAVFGSEDWTDYTVSGEVRLDGTGQAGLAIRVSAPSVGADAHRGYYAGIESSSGLLIFGRQDYGWTGLRLEPVAGGVSVGTWYELTVTASGCDFIVTAKQASGPADPSVINVTDPGCFTNGAVAARSHFTPASWRSIEVTP